MSDNGNLLANRYQFLETIGAGGMGIVFKALDSHTQSPVAIKKLKTDDFSDVSALLARFQREGEALRRLNHPNIVKMLDTFAENGDHYLVMELVEGGSLAELATQSMPIADLLPLSLDIADALTRAHRLNIIHRDLKPANVLIAADGTPRLSDFGIAYVGKQAGANITTTGAIVGTPHYLAPEMLKGVEPSPSSDIWAFGVLLFELVARRKPFDGNHLSATFAAIFYEPPPDLEALRPDAPLALVDLIYRMLDKDPQTRISSVRLVGAELEALLQGKSTAKPQSSSKISAEATFLIESRFAASTLTGNVPKHNLPANLTAFIGRENELAEVARLLHDPQNRLITILASGGMGKTRLGIEVATRELPNFANGVYLVELAPLSTVDSIPTALALALNFQFYEGKPQDQQIIDYLREKQALLVMDNFEHLLDGTVYVSEILKHAPQVKIIATSRESLNLQEEVRFRLSGLDFPDWETPEDALEYSAVKLFIQSARRVMPNFELTRDDLNYLARICRLVQGMPLGIVLAAAWVNSLSLAEITDEISASLDFLETDSRNVPDRHRSIRAVFETSWEKLSSDEQRVFAQMSVFRGGFSRKAAQTVTGVSLRTLNTLVDKSLLLRHTDTGTYDVHELLRQYAEQPLAEMGLEETTRTAHCKYYCQVLADRNEPLRGPDVVKILHEIESDLENIKLAWDWAVTHQLWEQLGQALDPLTYGMPIHNHYQEMRELLQKTARLNPQALVCPDAIVWARLKLQQALRLHISNNLYNLAEATIHECIKQLIACDAEIYTAHGYSLLGSIRQKTSQLEQAKEYIQKALDIAIRYQDFHHLGYYYFQMGWIKYLQNDIAQAKHWGKLALRHFEARGELNRITWTNGFLADCFAAEKDTQNMIAYNQKARLIAEKIGSHRSVVAIPINLGWGLFNLERNIEEGRQLTLEGLAIAKELGFADDCVPYINLAFMEAEDANYALARTYLHKSIQIIGTEQFGTHQGISECLVIWAMLTEAQNDFIRAVELVGSAFAHPGAYYLTQSKEVSDRLIARLKSKLAPEDYQAAWERGQNADYGQLYDELLKELNQL